MKNQKNIEFELELFSENLPLSAQSAAEIQDNIYILNMLGTFSRDGSELHGLLRDYEHFSDFFAAPAQRNAFCGSAQFNTSEAQSRGYLKKYRFKILKTMLLFENNIVYGAVKKKSEKFNTTLGLADLILEHDAVAKAIYTVCHTILKNGRISDQAYTIATIATSMIARGKVDNLLDALSRFVKSNMSLPRRLDELRTTFFISEVESWGIDTKGIDFNDQLFDKFDRKNLHLIGDALGKGHHLNEDNKERLRSIFSATLKGEFEKFIDTDPVIGPVNRNTQKVFEKYNLDFEKWTRPGHKLDFMTSKGIPHVIQAWKRLPGHDAHIGSYAGTCTALDSSNAKAIIETLTFKVVQHLEIREKGNDRVVGKVLLFWVKAEEHETPLLIADNMAVLQDLCNDSKVRDAIASWIQQLQVEVSGRPAPLYMGYTLNFIAHEDLKQKDQLTMQVLGNTDNNLLYSNALNHDDEWADITKTFRLSLLLLRHSDGSAPVAAKIVNKPKVKFAPMENDHLSTEEVMP